MKLMTIGYEGLATAQFFDLLTAGRVQTIVDVRELPLSRKPGFSKSALALSTAAHSLEYIHVPALGCPREIRHEYRDDGDWQRYTRRFRAYLSTQTEAIHDLSQLAQRNRCCLLCYEADPNFCHRLFVAERVVEIVGTSLKIVHLMATAPIGVEGAYSLMPL
ncbi:MAG: DUF488 domain-containing protein [Chloroflexi bacterium]|nr:DUF488 domain-containing protein [Chloroflexota bacterium]